MTCVLFVYDRPDSHADLGEDARQAIFAEYEALEALPGLAGQRLESVSKAVTVRIRDGDRAQVPTPLSQQLALAGFYLTPVSPPHARRIAKLSALAERSASRRARCLNVQPTNQEARK
jgi:hypothetical protein